MSSTGSGHKIAPIFERSSEERSEIALGLVGMGRLAQHGYLPALRAAAGVRLAAVAELDPERRALAGAGVASFASAEHLIAGGSLDAVLIATPPETHPAVAQTVAEAGIPMLVEKPPATERAGAEALAALHPLPFLGFNRRFDPGMQRLRASLPASGRLDVELEFSYRRSSWSAYVATADALLDVGCHLIDLAGWLGRDRVARVRAATVERDEAVLELDAGRARCRVACRADSSYRERVEIRDADGRRLARDASAGLLTRVTRRITSPRAPSAFVLSLARQLEAFTGAVRGGDPGSLATAAEGVAVMAAIDAARASAAGGGQWVSIA